ncbi:abortive infection bacteriophage resistance protein [Azomonas agilis]|uniref:Abortive infection bacteriophage resistance protein n=1 Tax=Azomonas agilis TaxID=116849 RepID=A0A562IK23_9GAMM|nr:Abi family protein [Azomonas agilis]TWH71359.1 abortive infection bacteriophage resistance protein [Azomonas agilis]
MSERKVYDKPFLSPLALVTEYLPRKGLLVNVTSEEKEFATSVLSQINWYKLKIYFYPFLDREKNNQDQDQDQEMYIKEVNFEFGLNLYRLDEEIRNLLIKYLLPIEIISNTIIDQSITEWTKDSFWYLDDAYFSQNTPIHERAKINDSLLKESKAESNHNFSRHYLNKYSSPCKSYRNLPPFWIANELISFDVFLNLLDKLNYQAFDKDGENCLDLAARKIGVNSFKDLKNWLAAFKDARNKACHSNRVWNTWLKTPRGIVNYDGLGDKNNLKENTIYLIFTAIKIVYNKNRWHASNMSLKDDLSEIINRYKNKVGSVDLEREMYFPNNWGDLEVWS